MVGLEQPLRLAVLAVLAVLVLAAPILARPHSEKQPVCGYEVNGRRGLFTKGFRLASHAKCFWSILHGMCSD